MSNEDVIRLIENSYKKLKEKPILIQELEELREENRDMKKEIEELKAEIDVQNEQIIALETVLDEKEKVIATDKAMLEDSISKGQVAKNYIKKAKIEDKIKEYNTTKLTINICGRHNAKTFQLAVREDVQKVLKELLEEE